MSTNIVLTSLRGCGHCKFHLFSIIILILLFLFINLRLFFLFDYSSLLKISLWLQSRNHFPFCSSWFYLLIWFNRNVDFIFEIFLFHYWEWLNFAYRHLIIRKHYYFIIFFLFMSNRWWCLFFAFFPYLSFRLILLLWIQIIRLFLCVSLLMESKECLRRRWIHHWKGRISKRRHRWSNRRIVLVLAMSCVGFRRQIHHRIEIRRWGIRKWKRKHIGIEGRRWRQLLLLHNNCIISKRSISIQNQFLPILLHNYTISIHLQQKHFAPGNALFIINIYIMKTEIKLLK